MKPYENLTSKICPLDIPNVDTDQIIPKQFLKRVERVGFGEFLFYDWRYMPDGKENPDFCLNKKEYKDSAILLSRDNFGCGSSREHAPWALLDFGFKCIIAPSYADIFYNNCFQNGILPVILKTSEVDQLFSAVYSETQTQFTVNLQEQTISTDKISIHFDIDPEKKDKLLNGIDDIGWTLKYDSEIEKYEKAHMSY